MHLKNLTIKGFKSFADKTTLLFDPPPSITAIVGPNGCGKSNIVDALKFVIGEQSIKELRGETLEEVIFAGSAAKKALSMGEVSILIDNHDSGLKTQYSEVEIKRRVFRSGESEFYINKNLVRLKDIKELFLDTGVGNGAYSIVDQGQVDSILSSKPEERRAVFEEAAGIGKYRFKKRATERRLIGTEQNLLRINDLRGEIKDNISMLEIQAEKAKEYKTIKERLKELEIGLGKKQIGLLTSRKDALLKRIDDLKKQTRGAEDNASQEEEERAKLKETVKKLDEESEELRKRVLSARQAEEEAKSTVKVGKERLFQLGERQDQLVKESSRISATLELKSAKLSGKTFSLEEYQNDHGQAQNYFKEASLAFDEISKKIEESVKGWNSLKNPIFEKEMEISDKKHSISEIELSLKFANSNMAKDTAFLENLKGFKSDLMELEREVDSLQGISNELKERIKTRKDAIFQKIDAEMESIEKTVNEQRANIESISKKLSEEKENLSSIENTGREMTGKFSLLEEKMKKLTEEKERAIAHLAEKRESFKGFETMFDHKRKEKEGLAGEIKDLEEELKLRGAETASLAERIEQTKKEIDDLEQGLPALSGAESILESRLLQISEKKTAKQARIEMLEDKIRALTSEDRNIRDELSKEEISLAKLDGELSNIELLLREEYQMNIADVASSAIEEVSNSSKAKEEIEGLKTKIREMGAVNLLAVEEFEAAKERLSFIEAQYLDIVNARESLNSLIKELDIEARIKFLKTIESVNENLTELFSKLFEGGEAKISLLEGDPLEAGIEIVARPSGKKWMNLSLMSGGEKALTAISILFSLMRTNPSPFCFMDEVDAALDEINTIRFSKLLKDFSDKTQIVVITHSKRSMSAAGTMYGITMEDPGISKVVSMKLVKVAD